MDISHIISFINEYIQLDVDASNIPLFDHDAEKLNLIKHRVLVRTFFNQLSDKNQMDIVDEFVHLYNEVWTPEYDEQYEKDKIAISNNPR